VDRIPSRGKTRGRTKGGFTERQEKTPPPDQIEKKGGKGVSLRPKKKPTDEGGNLKRRAERHGKTPNGGRKSCFPRTRKKKKGGVFDQGGQKKKARQRKTFKGIRALS